MQALTSTPKLSLTGTSLVQITDGAGDLSNVSVESLDINIQRINAAVLAATNAIPSRLTDGTAYYDARQITQWLGSTAPTVGQKTMANSVPVVIASNQTYVPAGIVVGTVYDPTGAALTVKSASATYNPPTAGNQATPLVAAVVGKKISVLAYNIQLGVSSANTYLRDGTAGAQLSVLFLRATGGSVPTAYIEGGSAGIVLFATTAGNALITNCATNTGTVSIQVTYVEL
jgi:hypothetical protein